MRVVREFMPNEMEQLTPASRASWTIREALAWTTQYFRRWDVGSARFEAEELLAHALGADRLKLYLEPHRALSTAERSRFRTLVQQRRSGTPSAYLVGKVGFMSAEIQVDPNVLIPRAETEELVERILSDFSDFAGIDAANNLKILDLGTGSGAIAIALLKAWPSATAVAADISPQALAVARANAAANQVLERISLTQSDWTANVTGLFDLIVANPPYIASGKLQNLDREVLEHEPRVALDGGPQGLTAITRIVRESPPLLKPGRPLYLEIGFDQARAVGALLAETAQFSEWKIFQDLSGRDRMARAIRGES